MTRAQRRSISLPKRVSAPGGYVTVKECKGPKVHGEEVWGSWDPITRRIEIEAGLAPQRKWHTFYHELAHVAMGDSGAQKLLRAKEEEVLCEAFATARMRERFG